MKAAASCLALAAVACGPGPPGPDVVARLDGGALTHAEFQRSVEETLAGLDDVTEPAALSALFDRFLEQQLLERLAAREAVGVARLVERGALPVEAEDVRRLYESRYPPATGADRIDLLQLLVTERELAEEAVVRLRRGEPFDSVAVSLTLEPGVAQAWAQDGVTAGDLPEELQDVVFALQLGGVSDVVQGEHGYAVFQVAGRRTGGRPPLAAVRADLEAELAGMRREEARERLVETARRGYDLAVFERNLPFTYRGRFSSKE